MNYSEKITRQLKIKELRRTWLAQNLGMRYVIFLGKITDNSFTKEEKEKIKILLGDDSEEKRELMRKTSLKSTIKELLNSIG